MNGKVDGSPTVDYSYGTDYSTGNYNRLNYLEYPDGRKIWNGYTHAGGAGTFQDTINDKFSRVGQIARDNSGSIGDILAEYDFNGLGRMVRRVHDNASGEFGNDTRTDLWHSTSGWYKGLDRFGRISNMKFADFSGAPTDFTRRNYSYDRNSNRESIEHVLYAVDSQSFTYDNLNRLTNAELGILSSSNVVQHSDAAEIVVSESRTAGPPAISRPPAATSPWSPPTPTTPRAGASRSPTPRPSSPSPSSTTSGGPPVRRRLTPPATSGSPTTPTTPWTH